MNIKEKDIPEDILLEIWLEAFIRELACQYDND
jgi:hypothetical protein